MKITNDLLDGRIPGIEGGERVDEFVNLYDSGDRGSFTGDLGFLENSFPGVDPPGSPATGETVGGDIDEYFATEGLDGPDAFSDGFETGGHQPAPMAAGR